MCVICVVIVMHELLVSCITLAQGMSPSPVLLPPRRRRPRCVVVVVVVVVAFLCRRVLLRCVAVALFVVVAWVEVLNLCFVCPRAAWTSLSRKSFVVVVVVVAGLRRQRLQL